MKQFNSRPTIIITEVEQTFFRIRTVKTCSNAIVKLYYVTQKNLKHFLFDLKRQSS